jgi:hypothetical protein
MCDWAPNRPRSRPSRVRSSGAARPRAQNRERADARNDRPVTGGHRLERQPKVKFRGFDYGWSTARTLTGDGLPAQSQAAAHRGWIGRPLELSARFHDRPGLARQADRSPLCLVSSSAGYRRPVRRPAGGPALGAGRTPATSRSAPGSQRASASSGTTRCAADPG